MQYAITHKCIMGRVRWVYDSDYRSEGSFAYDTEEETRAAVEEEARALYSGECVALGALVETLCTSCGQWETKDSLWGIVTENSEEHLEALGNDLLDLSALDGPNVADLEAEELAQ